MCLSGISAPRRAAGQTGACARSPRRGRRGSVPHADDPQRHGHRRHRRAAGRTDERRHPEQPDRADHERRDARRAQARGRAAAADWPGCDRRHRHVSDAGIRQPSRPSRGHHQGTGSRVRLQALDGARRYRHPRRRARVAGLCPEGEGAQRVERDRRAAHLQLPAAGRRMGQGSGRYSREGARVGAVVRRQRRGRHEAGRLSAGDHGGAARRREEARARIHGAPGAARCGADERAHGRQAGARHRHALLRALRSAPPRLPGPAVARRT